MIPFNLTLARYAEFVKSRAKYFGDLKLDLHHATTGCATEAGEALSTTKKMWIYGQNLNTQNKEGQSLRDNLHEELGDMLFYIQHACNLLETDIFELLHENKSKLSKRYPQGYTDEAANIRADKDGTQN